MRGKDIILVVLAIVGFAAAVIINAALSSGETEQPTIVIKASQTEPPTEIITTESVTETPHLDLNSASQEELMLLPGIAEALAAKIVSYRERSGGFRNIEELLNVDGIGEKIFDSVREYVYVIDPVYDPTEPTVPPATTAIHKEKTTKVQPEVPEEEFPAEPLPEEPEPEPETEEPTLTIDDISPIDLNTAEEWQLLLLPYVDEAIAGEILDLRQRIGRFSHVYELLYVESLEQWQVAEIIEYLEVTP